MGSIASTITPELPDARFRLVAPLRHTVVLAGVFLGTAAAGALYQRAASQHAAAATQTHPNVVPLYLSLLALQWGLFLYVWWIGLRRNGTSLAGLIGGHWRNPMDVGIDVAIAAGTWGAWQLFALAWNRWLGPGHAVSVQTLLPHGAVEVSLWIALSLTAGFNEELVFRGYFQRQFAALSRSQWLATLLQAALFGVSHGYQGVVACLKIMFFGVLFGRVALWRRSLRPGMLAHAWTDIAAGLF
jgi:membrane protease YdiL (CAAX protease family)